MASISHQTVGFMVVPASQSNAASVLLNTSAKVKNLIAVCRVPAADDAFGRAGWIGAARQHAAAVWTVNERRQLVNVASDELRPLHAGFGVPNPRGVV
jgi:hypothetical protein